MKFRIAKSTKLSDDLEKIEVFSIQKATKGWFGKERWVDFYINEEGHLMGWYIESYSFEDAEKRIKAYCLRQELENTKEEVVKEYEF